MKTFETVQPFFSQLAQRCLIYRSRVDRERFYFANIENEIAKLPSVTTILAYTLPMEDWLVRWIAKWGYERAIEKRDQSAHYGTLFSIVVSDFIKNRQIDLNTIEARINAYRLSNYIDFSTDFWERKLKEDLYALSCFVADYQFEPLAVELPLFSAKYRFAGTIDAIGYMQIGSGQNGKILKRDKETKRVLAIIDWKTGRHGFYRSHEAQLHMYQLLFTENYPEFADKDIRLYNWSPKDWESEEDAKYTIKDQTQSQEALSILNYLAIYQSHKSQKEYKIKTIEGVLKFGQSNGNLKFIDYKDIVKNKITSSNASEKTVCQHSDIDLETMQSNATPIEVPPDALSQIESFFKQIKED